MTQYFYRLGLPRWLSGKECSCQRSKTWVDPWVRKIPWKRKWQSTPVSLPGRSYGEKNLAGYSPQGCKKSDTTEHIFIYYNPLEVITK